MKYLIFTLSVLLLISCSDEVNVLDGESIINKSILKHDPNGNWDSLNLQVHIQEPRLSYPYRYSILRLDNAKNSFELTRNRDEHLSKHIIDSEGNSVVLLDGNEVIDTVLMKKYRLDPIRNVRYQKFYHLFFGLPMTLTDKRIKEYRETGYAIFNGKKCYEIEIELHEEMISKIWNIYLSELDYSLTGIEIFFPEDNEKGERIYFEHEINIGQVFIPRIRHWFEYNDNSYSGSDIIIKEVE